MQRQWQRQPRKQQQPLLLLGLDGHHRWIVDVAVVVAMAENVEGHEMVLEGAMERKQQQQQRPSWAPTTEPRMMSKPAEVDRMVEDAGILDEKQQWRIRRVDMWLMMGWMLGQRRRRRVL